MKKFIDILEEIKQTRKAITAAEARENELVESYMKFCDLRERHEARKAAENDMMIDSPYTEGVCKNGFPNCKLVKIPGTGHCLTQENDEAAGALRLADAVRSIGREPAFGLCRGKAGRAAAERGGELIGRP